MLRNLPIVLGVAAIVVGLFLLLRPGLFLSDGPLPEGGTAPASLGPTAGGAEPPPDPDAQRAESLASGGKRGVSAPASVRLDPRKDAAILAGTEDLIRAAYGYTPLEINRSRRALMTAAIYKVREAWRLDPRPEIVDYLVQRFNEVDDLGFRYAMTWLFRWIQRDPCVEPVAGLVDQLPLEVTDTLADMGTEKSFKTLAELAPSIEDEAIRCQLYTRLGRSSWPDADIFLQKVYDDGSRTPLERMRAVQALGHRPPEEALHRALTVALGDAVPLNELEDGAGHYPVRDLRLGAALAVMRLGDQDAVLKLLDEAEQREDRTFARIVDHSLAGYRGADITQLLRERVQRRGTIGWGEASYLMHASTSQDLAWLRDVRRWADSDRARVALDAAIRRLEHASKAIKRKG